MTKAEEKLLNAIEGLENEKFVCDLCGRELPHNAFSLNSELIVKYKPQQDSAQAKLVEEHFNCKYDADKDCEIEIDLNNMCNECFAKIINAIKDTIEEIKK